MVRIEDSEGRVLVLDKVKKEGWEGLTFPGGKVEAKESLVTSVRREAKEETGLDLGEVSFSGIIEWIDQKTRLVGLLYSCKDFSGSLVESEEGPISWMDYEEFKKIEEKSDSMDDILAIYEGKYQEIQYFYQSGQLVEIVRN